MTAHQDAHRATRHTHWVDVGGGAAAAVLAFGVIPAVLVVIGGLPVPPPRELADPASRQVLFNALTVGAWIAWAACAWPIARAVVRRVRTRDVGTADRALERVAVRIAAAALSVGTLFGASVVEAGAQPLRRHPADLVASSAAPRGVRPVGPVAETNPQAMIGARAPASAPSADPLPHPTPPTTWTVRPGDSLWSIADAVYGDGADWEGIAAANLGRPMADGTLFLDPSLILPGWVLAIPAQSQTTTGSPAPAATTTARSRLAAAPASSPAVAADGTASATGAPDHRPPSSAMVPVASRSPSSRRATDPMSASAPHRRRAPTPVRHHDPVPFLAASGCGVLVAALLARRVRRERRLAAFVRRESEVCTRPASDAAGIATDPGDVTGMALQEMVELAWGLLPPSAPVTGGEAMPPVRAVRAGAGAVEVCLDGPSPAPEPWEPVDDSTWLLSTDAVRRFGCRQVMAAPELMPRRPVLLPVGHDDRGTWLVPLGAGECLNVLGPAAGDAAEAIGIAARSWSRHEAQVVTGDVQAAARAAATDSFGRSSASVLFLGDPADLGPALASRCAVLTTLAQEEPTVCLVVDSRAATLHPLGIVVRPHPLGTAQTQAIESLVSIGTGDPEPRPGSPGSTADLVTGDPLAPERVGPDATGHPAPVSPPARPAGGRSLLREEGAGHGPPGDSTGPVVRLLSAVARIDGLVAPIDPKRSRRAVELVAYLGMWHPDPITGDRLRARVLGTSELDAAAKTLFNTAGAARRALGTDEAGRPLLPLASRSGHYRLSASVKVDAVIAADLLRRGIDADAEEPVELLTQALRLVEGEPLGGVLSGYEWWCGEGHQRRLSDLVVDGACRLVRLTTTSGDVDQARWALDRARLVEPYSEALFRAAMVVAAASRDVQRLRREWDECRRLMDELDPGGMPSDETERLYERLRRKLSAGPEKKGPSGHEGRGARPEPAPSNDGAMAGSGELGGDRGRPAQHRAVGAGRGPVVRRAVHGLGDQIGEE